MSKVVVMNHPLISHKLSILRHKDTRSKDFRELLNEIASLMTFDICRDLQTKEVLVETPICTAKCQTLDKDIIIVPILRAGLGMVEGILQLIPTAKVGHIGLYRDEETHEPCEYYAKFPNGLDEATVIVLDPMLATGGSAAAGITMIKKRGAKDIRYIKTGDFELKKEQTPIFGTIVYWLYYLVPTLILLLYILINIKIAKLNSNIDLLKNKKANKIASNLD